MPGADPLNLTRVMPAQGEFKRFSGASPHDPQEGCALDAFKDTRVLTEAALAVALAFVLGLLTIFRMPFDGSVSLEMAPLVLLALRRGWKVGVVAGVVYGFLDLATPPTFAVHPVQVLFDYPLAFGALGLAGLFGPTARGAVVGAAVAVLARFACHFVSGVVFFASYAPEGWNPYVYSAVYNAAYLLPSLAIALVAVVVLLRALAGALPSPRQARYGQ